MTRDEWEELRTKWDALINNNAAEVSGVAMRVSDLMGVESNKLRQLERKVWEQQRRIEHLEKLLEKHLPGNRADIFFCDEVERAALRQRVEELEDQLAQVDTRRCRTCDYWEGFTVMGACNKEDTFSYSNECCSEWRRKNDD